MTDCIACTLQVGHNALGSGQVVEQGAKLVDESLRTGHFFEYDGWKALEPQVKDHTLHFIGLLSDGGVHSRYDQLKQMLDGVGCQCSAVLDHRLAAMPA